MERSERYFPDNWVVPEITEENRAFFTSGRIHLQRCSKCGHLQHPPLDICGKCQSIYLAFEEVPPYGRIDSYTVVHHPVHPTLRDRVPYNVCVIALDEHPTVRLVGNVIDVEPDDLEIGMAVTATWALVPSEQGELLLPQWSRRESEN